MRRRGDRDPRVVLIKPRPHHANRQPGEVELVGHKGWKTTLHQRAQPGGGAALFASLDPVGASMLVRRADVSAGSDGAGSNPWEILLPSGALVPLGKDDVSTVAAIDPYVFATASDSYSLFDAKTGKKIGSRPRDPTKDARATSNPIPVVHGGTRLIEEVHGFAEGVEVRVSSVPSLALGLARRGRVAAVAGSFALIRVPASAEEDADNTHVELVDLEGQAMVERIALPKRLPSDASFAISPDGRKIAAARFGGVHLYERASKRWTTPKQEIQYRLGDATHLSAIGFTSDGKVLCLRHVASSFFPTPPAAAAGSSHRAVFDSPRAGLYDGTCHVVPVPTAPGFSPLVDESFGYQLQHVGSAISDAGDLAAFLDVQNASRESGGPREVLLTVVEIASGKVRYRVSTGTWKWEYGADQLTVDFHPSGVWVNSTTEDKAFGGLFDLATGKRVAPMWVGSRDERVPFNDLISLLGPKTVDPKWMELEGGERLFATDRNGTKRVLSSERTPSFYRAPFEGGPASGATLVDNDGFGVWMFANDGSGLLGTLLPAGKGAIALLEGGACDLVGDADESKLGCLVAPDQLLPLSACKARFYVPGAVKDARAGKRTWLAE